jgi:tetratricopeptide (TPR) repeat protein
VRGELGFVLKQLGEPERAEQELRRALEIAERIDDPESAMRALSRLSDVAWWRGNRGESVRLRREALRIARDAGNPRTTAAYLLALADVEREVGEQDIARDHIEEGMELSRELGYSAAVVVGLTHVGRWSSEDGDHAAALRAYTEAAKVARDSAQDALLGDCVFGIALAKLALGDVDEALDRFREARESYTRSGRSGQPRASRCRGRLGPRRRT